ncbi:MAG: SUMF1/EgtB/PvdO family nonheme iron enzyme [Cytophagaceae bacterium]|nr:SUMF1/EgtB/PvdO family nonheme iron enzyme [Cytophagaceae bacterium]
MIGNVYEWTTSKYVKYDETDGSESNQFVIRGGGVYNSENDLKGYRIRHRNKQMYTGRFQGTGFRLVQEFTK